MRAFNGLLIMLLASLPLIIAGCAPDGDDDDDNDPAPAPWPGQDEADDGDRAQGRATGAQCRTNEECRGRACLVSSDSDVAGYCSNRCEDFTDCPDFWECADVGNAAGRYCVQDETF